MSRKQLKKSVKRYLEERNYVFLRTLGKGGYADVISVRTPGGQDLAVKIIGFNKISYMEDRYWFLLHHPNLLPLESVLTIDELNAKLYFMPVLPYSLENILHCSKFRKDPESFNRLKKWLHQILSALQYLHSQGLCHLDLNNDNVLIDNGDDAIVADFSGLNFTKDVNRLYAIKMFRPPEYFISDDDDWDIEGQAFDMWTYGILVLNTCSRNYFFTKASWKCIQARNRLNWTKHLKPILNKALKEAKFRKLLVRTFPKVFISEDEQKDALDFVCKLLNEDPTRRPTATEVLQHPFLQTKYQKKVCELEPGNEKSWFRKKFRKMLKRKKKCEEMDDCEVVGRSKFYVIFNENNNVVFGL